MKTRLTLTSCLATLAIICMVPQAHAQCDLWTTAADSMDPTSPGDVVTYTVTVGNNGPDESIYEEIVNIELPPGVGPDLELLLAGDPDALAAYDALLASIQVDTSIWDATASGLFFGADAYCEAVYIQVQDLLLPNGAQGNIYYEVPMPDIAQEKLFRFDSTSVNLDLLLNSGLGGCDDLAADCTGTPCMGPRLGATRVVAAELELVDDGTGVSTGCTAPVGFTPGKAALIDRGDCAFELKAYLAANPDGDPLTEDGASAVIIADSDNFGDSTVDPYDIINMACTDYCNTTDIPIPVMFVSWADGQEIHAAMAAAETVTVTLGVQESGGPILSTGYAWEYDPVGGLSTDRDSTNDRYAETTMVIMDSLFADGFESGDTSAWTAAVP